MTRGLIHHATLSALIVSSAASSLFAQVAPTDGSKGLRDLNLPRSPAIRPAPSEPVVGDELGKSAAAVRKGGPSIRVTKVIVLCADETVIGLLAHVARSREGRSCDYAELDVMLNEMREALASAGRVGAAVWLPRQDVTEGVIKVQVDLPRFGRAVMADSAPPPAYWSGVLARSGLREGAYLRSAEIERGLLLLERYEGSPVRGVLRPGSAEGMVDLGLQTSRESADRFGVFFDNHGSRYTGAARSVLSAETRGVSAIPDHVSVNGAVSEGMQYAGAQYACFPDLEGLRLGVSAGLMEYGIIEGSLAGSGVDGRSLVLGFAASHPIFMSSAETLIVELRADDRRVLEYTGGILRSDRRINSVSLGIQHSARSSTSASATSFFLTGGVLEQHVDAADAQDSAGPGVAGGYSKLKVEHTRQWPLASGILLAGLEGQVAFQNLDPSEELQVGGPYGVRSYPVGEGSIDSGMLIRAEWTAPLAHWAGWSFEGGVFADYAFVRPNGRPYSAYSGPDSYHLGGSGLQFAGRNASGFFFKALISNKIGKNAMADSEGNDSDGRSPAIRVWVQGGRSF